MQVIQYICKADKNPFKTSKMFHSNSSKISALHFKMSLAWVFCFELSQFTASLTTCHHYLFISSTLLSMTTSSVSTPYFIQNQLKFTQFSIPNTPGHLNTHVIIVNVYRSIGISKQSLSTNVPICIHVELIGQLPA